MSLSPSGEIAIRLVACNSRHSGVDLNFMDGGRSKLLRIAGRHARQLEEIRKLFQAEKLIEGAVPLWKPVDPIEWVAKLVSFACADVFTSGGMSTRPMVAAWYLRDFGYIVRNGFTINHFLDLSVWNTDGLSPFSVPGVMRVRVG